jgi:hemolysin activation/secretion protein
LAAFGATLGDGFPDSRFTSFLTQLQWVQRAFGGAGQWVLRAEGQFADSPLLGSEKYSIGGMDSVRGYRKDVMVRDTGWFGSVEYRHTVGHLALRSNPDPGEGAVRLAAFVDIGQARDRIGSNPSPSFLASYGPGVRWEPIAGLEVQLYRGHALKPIVTPTVTSQDRGLHFRLTFVRPF